MVEGQDPHTVGRDVRGFHSLCFSAQCFICPKHKHCLKTNTDFTRADVSTETKFGVNAGLWHGSMEMAAWELFPPQESGTEGHWTVLGGFACWLGRHTDARELRGKMRESA